MIWVWLAPEGKRAITRMVPRLHCGHERLSADLCGSFSSR